ncbi:MAG: type IV pilin [Methanocalculus sp. MSAO_Arc1]|uniref:helix-hairpin-helix domain-containing protein n=1 Tax=Methanocalculus TaxID=71151 RepID=UPI000FED060F|nr:MULTISPECIES: helix-hairpin-helix domain-containing protein [unclassified Methanocalculus]MCP1662109.1 DNA uptake protein ComE-like DNA-binding protein [Methanocalculus sp. AMF5]RQD80166.1 MAG: type IV pilin [Methanocalculus sp. MSAO_Arc1]
MQRKKHEATRSEDAVANVIGVILMVGLTAVAAFIVLASLTGSIGLVQKPSFIVADAAVLEDTNTEYIAVQHQGGDTVSLYGTDRASGRLAEITLAYGGAAPARAIADTPLTWRAGESVYLYTTITDGPRITRDSARAAALGVGFDGNTVDLVISDPVSEVIIAMMTLPVQGREARPGPGMVNINTASEKELQLIKNVGPVIAGRIIGDRPFASVDDLIRVTGIGETTLQQIKAQGIAYVGDTPQPAWVNINRASFADLTLIRHINEARAQQIIELRQESPFASVDDLTRIDGIGPGRLQDIKNLGIAIV